MEEETIDDLLSSLKTKMDELTPKSSPSLSSIFRTPHQLRQVNQGAYNPQIISIGPYHRDSNRLKAMEIHKIHYLKKLIEANSDDWLRRCVGIFSMDMQEKARSYYAGTAHMPSSTEFVMMMVLDGCFIVELIRKFMKAELREKDDALFKQNLNLTIVTQDLLLLENQLPFFVLNQLFEMIKPTNEQYSFAHMALCFFSGIMPGPGLLKNLVIPEDINDLLGLVHSNWLSSPEQGLKSNMISVADGKWKIIRSATELVEVGIRFKKVEGNSLFDINFEKGKLHIPTLTINHDTERIFRNLIAYELLNQGPSIVMDYTRLMDCLINYDMDVAFLSECGIIDNWLGSNEAVAGMFNKLNDYVYLSTANFYYSDVFDDVNKYYRRTWNVLKLKLSSKYSHTPWDWVLVSIIAATILLLLTLTQTIISVLDYVFK